MSSDLHLDISEISAFSGEPRSKQCEATMRHLLKCRECRTLLPATTTKNFWATVIEERDFSRDEPNESPVSHKLSGSRLFERIRAFFPPMRSAATAGALLLLIAVFSVLLLLNQGKWHSDDRATLVAVGAESQTMNSDEPPAGKAEFDSEPKRKNESGVTRVAGESKLIATGQRRDQAHILARKNSGRLSEDTVATRDSLLNRSETRGTGTSCIENSSVVFETGMTGSGLMFSWGKIQGAVAYTVYLSDLDERLIDQFETTTETSFLSAAKLEPETTYKWKLVVTLKGGRTILATSRNFRLADVERSVGGQGVSIRRKAASTRCMEEER